MRGWSTVALAVIAVGAAACAGPPSGGGQAPRSSTPSEQELGRELAAQIEAQVGLVDGSQARYVEAIGQRLVERSPQNGTEYHFHVMDTPEPNAFALPGGYIYVSRGLLVLLNSEDELANAIAHEVGHVAAGHYAAREARRSVLSPIQIATDLGGLATGVVSPTLGRTVAGIGRLPGAMMMAKYSREQERDADKVGQELAAAAGWDPAAMATMLSTLAREDALSRGGSDGDGFLSSHPSSPERSAAAAQRAGAMTRVVFSPIAPDRTAFLKRMDGLLVGASGAEGVFIGTRFVHPDLDFTILFPADWETQNLRHLIAGRARDESAAMTLEILGKGDDPMKVAELVGTEGGVRFDETPAPVEIGAHAAVRATTRTGGFSQPFRVDLIWFAYGGWIFQVNGLSSANRFEENRKIFAAVVQTFGPVTEAERAKVTESRLRLYRTKSGESLAEIAARRGIVWSADEIAVANALRENDPIPRATWLKIAVSEPYRR